MTEPVLERDRLTAYLDELVVNEGADACPNGLQVEGKPSISRVVTGVSACEALFEAAIARQADAVLVHHGLFWKGDSRRVVGLQRRRIAWLIEADVNLYAYHLPLDRHPTLGNNALAARAFGIEDPSPFGEYDGVTLGFAGSLARPLEPAAFEARCEEVFGQSPLAFLSGPGPVRTAGFVSGAAQRMLHQAIDAGLDAFVTGEVSEWVMNVAKEAKVHYFAAGHYATERLGVRALGERIASDHGLSVEFVDVPNPV